MLSLPFLNITYFEGGMNHWKKNWRDFLKGQIYLDNGKCAQTIFDSEMSH